MTEPSDIKAPTPRNSAGHNALVLGIVAVVMNFVPVVGEFVAVPAAVGAIVAGYVGFDRADRRQATNPGDALVGAGLGVLTLFVTLIMWAVLHGGDTAS